MSGQKLIFALRKMNPVYRFLDKSLTNKVILRNYAFKSDLKIKWVRPEKIPCIRPEKSGDLKGKPEVNRSAIRYEFRNSEELAIADDSVKRLFTLEFGPRLATNKVYREDLIDSVKRHQYDDNSIEVRIAKWTGNMPKINYGVYLMVFSTTCFYMPNVLN